MKQRLVTFGCSHTFGHGLKDCINFKNNHPLDAPSKFAWPNLLGELLGLEVHNLSYPGSSAKQISHTILNSDIRENDIVIVLWPHHHRICFYKNSDEYIRIGPWMQQAENYYNNYYFEYDSLFEYYQKINVSDIYIKNRTSNSYHYIFEKEDITFSWNNVDIGSVYFSDIRTQYPLALDNLHPGHEAHRCFANEIYLERFQ